MADEEDLKLARAGHKDLAGRDLIKADLANADLTGANLTAAQLSGANLQGARMSGAKLKNARLENADLTNAIVTGANFENALTAYANFSRADLRSASFNSCPIQESNFTGADIRGTDFSRCHFFGRSEFLDCIHDSSTLFDGVTILRSISNDPIFREYEYKDGQLIRKPTIEIPDNSSDPERTRLSNKIDQIIREIVTLEPVNEEVRPLMMGHNNPPEPTPLTRRESNELVASLRDIKTELLAVSPDGRKIASAASSVGAKAKTILHWLGKHADTAADEFAKGMGKNLSDPLRLAATWAILTSGLFEIIKAVVVRLP